VQQKAALPSTRRAPPSHTGKEKKGKCKLNYSIIADHRFLNRHRLFRLGKSCSIFRETVKRIWFVGAAWAVTLSDCLFNNPPGTELELLPAEHIRRRAQHVSAFL